MLEESMSSSPTTFMGSLYSWFTPTVFFLLLQLVIGTIFIISNLAHNNNNNRHPHEHDQHHDFPQHHLHRSPSILQRLKSINLYPYRSQLEDPHFHSHDTHHHQNQNEPHQQQQQQQQQPQLARSPSLLQRLKSINLYTYFPTQPLTSTTHTPHVPDKSFTPHVPQQQQHVVETDEDVEEDYDDYVVENENYDYAPEEDGVSGSSLDEIYSKLRQGKEGRFARRTKSDTKPASGEVAQKLSRKMKKSASSRSAFAHFREEDIVETRRPATVKEGRAAAMDDAGVDAKADDFINKFKQQLKLQRLDSIIKYKEMIGRGGAAN